MRLNNILNAERVNALSVDPNAYIMKTKPKQVEQNPRVNGIPKVIFPEPYENAGMHYRKNEFSPPPQEPPQPPQHQPQQNMPMFDFKSLLPMLMSGKLDILKPLMSMFGGGNGGGSGVGGMDFAKIFELFKPKAKPKKEEKKEEDISSKFDDMIIIED